MPDRVRILAFMNAYTSGKSGGDVAFVECFKRMKSFETTIVTSRLGMDLCKELELSHPHFVVSTEETMFNSLLFTYFKRIVFGCKIALLAPLPDIVYASSDILPDTIPAVLIKIRSFFSKKKVLYFQKFFHINDSSRKLSYFLQKFSLLLLRRFVDRVSTCSEYGRNLLIQRKFVCAIDCNEPGVYLDVFRNLPSNPECFDAVYLGRIASSKGIVDLINIWSAVVKRMPLARLCIIGTGPIQFVEHMNSIVDALGLRKNILIKGYMPLSEGFGIVKNSKLFLLPSHEEGFGIVLLEAMACGTPAISYDLPPFQQLFGNSISTVRCFDRDAFAEAVVERLNDEALRNNVKIYFKGTLEKFSWEKCAARELASLESLLKC